ncbi:MAG: hypothetical protein HYV63_00900 [Candidatus Schekmanbacteria bacterium]|nr:hypothetical protein [Candidatus Schekmanbacteria bacterium]
MPATDPGTIIQFGSGHPGEDGSAAFEAALLAALEPAVRNVLFFPFHAMPPDSGDLARFTRIHGARIPGWIRCAQLRPPELPDNLAEILAWLHEADLIVLGSGFPEPYIDVIRRLEQPPDLLRQLHLAGKHFVGYSAGTLAIGEGYFRPFTGRDLLLQLDLLDHISLAQPTRDELEATMRGLLKRDDAQEFLDALRARLEAEEPLTAEQDTFLAARHWMEQSAGFRLNPGITGNPHFGGRFHYLECHLRILGELFPDYLHVGLPNACALVTRHDGGSRRLTFRAARTRLDGMYLKGGEEPVALRDGDLLPLS